MSTAPFTSIADTTRTVTITVSDPAPAQTTNSGSSDATLKSLTVAGKTYTSPNTDTTVTVESSVDTATVSAVTSSSSAKVTGTGTKELAVGTNVVTLTVTAENGTTKKYTVRIRKLADSDTTPNVTDTPAEETPPQEEIPEILDLRLNYLLIEDVEMSPEFDSEVFEYTVNVTNRDSINIVAASNVEDATIEITGDKELVDGENEVIIKISKEGQQEVEYRITVYKTTEEVPLSVEDTEDDGGFFSTVGGRAVIVLAAILVVRGNRICNMEIKICR